MTAGTIVELMVAAGLFAAGVYFYRRRDPAERYGSQGAVLLFVFGALLAVHALGLMKYRPSAAEAEMFLHRGEGSSD